MRTIPRAKAAGVIFGSLVLLGLSFPTLANADPTPKADDYIIIKGTSTAAPDTELSRVELDALAESLGLDPAGALEYVAGQNAFGATIAQLEEKYSDVYFSSGWESGDGYRAWVSFDEKPAPEVLKLLSTLPFDTQVRFDASASLSELEELVATTSDALTASGVQEASVSFDPRTGAITARYVATPTVEVSTMRNEVAVLRQSSPVPVVLEPTRAGGETDNAVIGGLRISTYFTPICTVGFTVTKSSTNGVVTAGHCANDVLAIAGSPKAVNYKAEHRGSEGDFQWMSTADTIQNKTQYHSAGYTKSITSLASASVGTAVCVWGGESQSTTCGLTTNTSTCSTASGVTVCKLVVSDGKFTVDGDSGGPWSFNAAAYGIHKGTCGGKSCYSKIQNAQSKLGVKVKLS